MTSGYHTAYSVNNVQTANHDTQKNKCSVFWNVFLSTYLLIWDVDFFILFGESEFLKNLLDQEHQRSQSMYFLFRYSDDVFSNNKPKFSDRVQLINHREQIKETTARLPPGHF